MAFAEMVKNRGRIGSSSQYLATRPKDIGEVQSFRLEYRIVFAGNLLNGPSVENVITVPAKNPGVLRGNKLRTIGAPPRQQGSQVLVSP